MVRLVIDAFGHKQAAPPAELSDDEIQREARARLEFLVHHELSRPAGNKQAYRDTLVRLTELRIEVRRRARLN